MAYLGIDTSNYTSSCALAENGHIISDYRQLLKVKDGENGLRQSDALFQHWENMPKLLHKIFDDIHQKDLKLDAVVVSIRPRPQEGSYMPVFNAGKSIAHIISYSMNIPVFELSHQDGHIMAAAYNNYIDFEKPIVCAHLSGGTLELVTIKDSKIEIIGGTKDISYGQLIDRCGVMMGYPFPAGKTMDTLALGYAYQDKKSPFKRVNCDGSKLNLSGIETQIKRAINRRSYTNEELAYFLMSDIADSFINIISSTKISQVLVTGGVASSQFLRERCKAKGYIFGQTELCSDNACGLALSEGKLPWLKQ